MENRKSEIDNIVPSFTASMMDLISRHRQKRDAVNQVPGFIEAVERERERMTAKFNALLSNQDYADLAHEIHAAQHQVNQTCEAEIARASASQTVEFDTLTGALRDTHRSLDRAVNRIERKGE
jgi:chemotaxis regulatin CheY-phosphate phosphatase CheZ